MAVVDRGTQTLPSDGISQESHEQIRRDVAAYYTVRGSVKLFRDYSRGKHALTLTDKQKIILANLAALEGHEFCDNICHQITAEARDRLRFDRWVVAPLPKPGAKPKGKPSKAQITGSTPEQAFLSSLYKTAKIGMRQGEIHYDTLRDAEHVLAVGWSNKKERVMVYREPWYSQDSRDGAFIGYDGEDEPYYGFKDWHTVLLDEKGHDTNVTRRNLWFPDRLEKWVTPDGGTAWEKYLDPEDNGQWPIPWVKVDGSPLHIPYVHFRNSGRGTINYGFSELDGGIIGFQDQINDLHWALSGSGRLTAFQMYYIAGIDPTVSVDVGPGQVWKLADPQSTAGAIAAGDLTQLISLLDKKLGRVSVVSRTPEHRITGGNWPSGEALMRAEQPAVGKAEAQIESLLDSWSEVGHRAIEIFNHFNTEGVTLPEDIETASVAAVFLSPERRDPLSKSIIAQNLRDSITWQEELRIMEYDEERINKIGLEKEANMEMQARTMQSAFDRGLGPGTALPGKGPQGAQEDEESDTGDDTGGSPNEN